MIVMTSVPPPLLWSSRRVPHPCLSQLSRFNRKYIVIPIIIIIYFIIVIIIIIIITITIIINVQVASVNSSIAVCNDPWSFACDGWQVIPSS